MVVEISKQRLKDDDFTWVNRKQNQGQQRNIRTGTGNDD